MADNTTLNTGVGGDTLATDDIGGIKYPRGKITLGADGVNDGDVSVSNPLPTNDNGTQTILVNIFSDVANIDGKTPALGAAVIANSVPVNIASNQIVPVSGTVAVTSAGLTNLDVALSTRTKPSDQQHVIIDSSASLTVSGPLTDTQLRATPVPISGAVTNANLDVALSTRTKPSDQQHAIIDSGSVTVNVISGFALESGGNLASIKTNTDPLVTAAAGGYVRQDSTGTIAKESGGNLATLAALSKAEDAASANGDTGIPTFATRKDDPSVVLTSDNGDYATLVQDRYGNLMVTAVEEPTIRRAQELAYLNQMQATMATMLLDEPSSSQRMGFEIR